jgi:hypothetical protein
MCVYIPIHITMHFTDKYTLRSLAYYTHQSAAAKTAGVECSVCRAGSTAPGSLLPGPACVCAHLCIHMTYHTNQYTHTHAYTQHAHIHTHTHTRTYTHTHTRRLVARSCLSALSSARRAFRAAWVSVVSWNCKTEGGMCVCLYICVRVFF